MNWHLQAFDTLTIPELYAILQLRSKVFVVEQQCVYQDMDGKDRKAMHLWCSDQQNNCIAYCRLLPPGISYTEASIGRVVTDPDHRKGGMGRLLMEKAIAVLTEEKREPAIRISAQEYLQRFYESLGFARVSESYLEDGIPHIEMLLAKTT